MSKDWHSGHFCCWNCDESLTGQRYVLRDEHPYCIKCYEQVFANTCEECSTIIGIDSKVSSLVEVSPYEHTTQVFNFLSPSYRIWAIKTNIGMKPASCVRCVAFRWSTNNLVRNLIRFIVEIVTTRNLPAVAMDAAKSSVLVSFLNLLSRFIIEYDLKHQRKFSHVL